MNNWSKCEESIRSLEAIAKLECRKRRNSSKKLSNVGSNTQLDTASVCRKLQGILKAKRISKEFFAKPVLSIYTGNFCIMLRNPKPWVKCSEYKK